MNESVNECRMNAACMLGAVRWVRSKALAPHSFPSERRHRCGGRGFAMENPNSERSKGDERERARKLRRCLSSYLRLLSKEPHVSHLRPISQVLQGNQRRPKQVPRPHAVREEARDAASGESRHPHSPAILTAHSLRRAWTPPGTSLSSRPLPARACNSSLSASRPIVLSFLSRSICFRCAAQHPILPSSSLACLFFLLVVIELDCYCAWLSLSLIVIEFDCHRV